MSDREHMDRSAVCDLLMREGLGDLTTEENLGRFILLADLAVELRRQDALDCAMNWCAEIEKRGVSGETAVLLDYNRANLIGGLRYGTTWQWEQSTLARELFYLRRAVSRDSFQKLEPVFKCMCLNNLGNRLLVAGRIIEALHIWDRALKIEPNFGMALCNRARALMEYGRSLPVMGMEPAFLWVAHKAASAAIAPTAIYTDIRRDSRNRDLSVQLKNSIEKMLNVDAMSAADPLNHSDRVYSSPEEIAYRQWCLENFLYLDPVNDLGPYPFAGGDFIGLPSHVVPVDACDVFESFHNQMIQEYVSARWLLYEGVTSKTPHFSDRDVSLELTEPRPSLSLAVEKVKSAFRTSYSLFDKIAFFVNAYMSLQIPDKQVSFRRVWQDEKKLLRKQFDTTDNWAFCALHWVSKDFFEEEYDEVAEPEARGLSEIRNHLEHRYLRVTAELPPSLPPQGDLALMVSRDQFIGKALHLLKLARSAIIYLAIGMQFEEKRREPTYSNIPLEDIPRRPPLVDAEKV